MFMRVEAQFLSNQVAHTKTLGVVLNTRYTLHQMPRLKRLNSMILRLIILHENNYKLQIANYEFYPRIYPHRAASVHGDFIDSAYCINQYLYSSAGCAT